MSLSPQYQMVGEEGDFTLLVARQPTHVFIQGLEYREAVDGREGVDIFKSDGPFEYVNII
jgi:hypothetical protein